MGAVLDKERVVREEDLSLYLKSKDAQSTYLQKPLNDNYALLSYLNNSFVKLPSGDEFILKSSANNLFQPKDDYVSLKDFNDYKTTANTTYQPKGDYLTEVTADKIYLKLNSDGKLCIGKTCINETELTIIKNSGSNPCNQYTDVSKGVSKECYSKLWKDIGCGGDPFRIPDKETWNSSQTFSSLKNDVNTWYYYSKVLKNPYHTQYCI